MAIPYLGAVARKKQIPYATMAPNFDLSKNVREMSGGDHRLFEFIGADDFGPEWYTRVRFEVNAGRLEVPLLYGPVYDEVVDATLPEVQQVKNWGPGGFIFEEIHEGGEVKFGQITAAEAFVSQRQFAVGVEYTKKLVMFNQLWEIARIERAVGRAHNALLNYLHFAPIMDYAYGAANQTAAATAGVTTTEDWYLTIENAIVHAQADTANQRQGPYILLVHPSKNFMLQRALTRVPQVGFALDGNIEQFISSIIGYSGWTGTRGKKTITYPAVTATKGYLINTGFRGEDFISLVKQPLESAQGNADVSRFILDQIVWDVWLGIFSNPARAVEEITFPT